MTRIHTAQTRTAAALQIKGFDPTSAKHIKALESRVIRLRIGQTCSRCLGSGHFSRCAGYGTTCFKCAGWTTVAPTTCAQWEACAERAEALAADGTVDRYIAGMQLERVARGAVDEVLDAWKNTGISARYDWMKAAEACRMAENGGVVTAELAEHRRVADINSIMCAAFDRLSKAAHSLPSPQSVSSDAYLEAVRHVAELRDAALKAISEAATLI